MTTKTPKKSPKQAKKKNPPKKRSPARWEDTVASLEQDLLQRGRSSETVIAYRVQINKFSRFYREQLNKNGPYVTRIHETDLYAFIDYLRNTCYQSVSTINKAVSALHTLAQYLIEQRLQRRNIAQGLKTVYVGHTAEPTRLTRSEIRSMLASIDLNRINGYRDYAIIQFFLQCGLSLSELIRLSRNDVTLSKQKGKVLVKDDKTHAERLLPLNASVRKALEQYLDRRGDLHPGEPLFISSRGGRISKQTVQYLAKKYLTAAGRPDLSVADLRRHFALGLYQKKKNLVMVQKALGHCHITTTARYLSVAIEELAEALEEMPDNVYHD